MGGKVSILGDEIKGLYYEFTDGVEGCWSLVVKVMVYCGTLYVGSSLCLRCYIL